MRYRGNVSCKGVHLLNNSYTINRINVIIGIYSEAKYESENKHGLKTWLKSFLKAGFFKGAADRGIINTTVLESHIH